MKEKNEHRDKVKKIFAENGLDDFQDHQVLELMLFYCIHGKDTSEIAHALLDRFGSFSAVLDAPVESLTECGISYNTAAFLKMIPPLCARYHQDSYLQKKDGDKSIENFILPYFIGQNEEQLFLVLLDGKGKIVFHQVVSRGTRFASSVNIQKIVHLGVQHHAACAVIAHNHPSGIGLPSENDIRMTASLQKALKSVGIVLLDHYIVTGMECHPISKIKQYKKLFL